MGEEKIYSNTVFQNFKWKEKKKKLFNSDRKSPAGEKGNIILSLL